MRFAGAGLAVGIAALQLPWTVVGVMLAGSTDYYEQQAVDLCEAFQRDHPGEEYCYCLRFDYNTSRG